MTLTELIKEARRDFIEAGPESHYPCPAGHATGQGPDGSGCLLVHFGRTKNRLSSTSWTVTAFAFEWAWEQCHGEGPTFTNERGYATCVEAYDQLVLSLEPTPTTQSVPTTEVVPA